MKPLFLNIIGKAVKDNTYKFALAKFLLDYSNDEKEDGVQSISYETIAEKFLEYYWFQECKYKFKQDFKIDKMPVVIGIIREFCGVAYIPESYEAYFSKREEMKKEMISKIEKTCLQDVIPRFQPRDSSLFYNHFHTLSPSGKKFRLPPKDKRYIELHAQTHQFLKQNYHELSKILIYEWARYLEKTNFTPRLIAKIEGLGKHKRASLNSFKKTLLKQMEAKCFYCEDSVEDKAMHVDHFIPWSYIYEDALWNLVISCPQCNLKKSDYLAPKACLTKIELRNEKHDFNEHNKDISEYYEKCQSAGFLTLEVEGCV